MTWSFPSIASPVECTYTQSVGFTPDVAFLRANPQVANVPTTGTLTFVWDATTITLPNCVVDLASLRLTEDGQYITLKVLDRRELWKYVAPISGEYNVVRVGDYVTAKKKSLRQLGTILMTALGEASAVVSALPTDIYPSVSWECESVVEAAEALFAEYGYSVALGFGSETVTVVKLGTGATLSTTDMFVGSSTMDPKFAPRYVRNCFRPSVAQVRFKMEAIGREIDGTWVPIDDLSFMPVGGWGKTSPYSLAGAVDALTDEQKIEAQAYVRRAYRPMGFADGTWDLPDGSDTITGLDDVLPIQNRLLVAEDIRAEESYAPFKVYGKYTQLPNEKAQPALPVTTDIGDWVTGMQYHFDGETGILIFEEPIFFVAADEYEPAELYLEATIQVRDLTNFQWEHYEYDVEIVPTGTGYHTVKHDLRAETIVEYDTDHVVTGTTTNQTALDALGDATAVAAAGLFVTSASQHIVYNKPKLNLRCDGAILQVQHIMTCGEHGHAVNRTTASRNFEFDRGIPSRAQRAAHYRAMVAGAGTYRTAMLRARRENSDD